MKGSLVQRELSAQLTEGLLNKAINVLAYALKIVVYFIVGDPQNRDVISLQKGISFGIMRKSCLVEMLGTIQFDHEFRLCTVEICDVFPENLLTGKRMG